MWRRRSSTASGQRFNQTEHYVIRKIKTLLPLVLLSGCGVVVVDLPAITEAPTGVHTTGHVIWHDLLTNTPEASRRFYGELFGWTFEKPGIDIGLSSDDDYMLIRHNGELIGGMLDVNTLERDVNISQWVTMISVADIDTAVAGVLGNGGKVLTPATNLASRGSLAVLEDPTGALFAMIQARGGDPAVSEPELNAFLWDELWTNNVSVASDFYENVFGYKQLPLPEDVGREFSALGMSDKPLVGVLANPFDGERPVWVNYLRVADPAAVTEKVEQLGGRIIIDAQARPIGGQVAFVAGPSGAGIALQTWPLDSGSPE